MSDEFEKAPVMSAIVEIESGDIVDCNRWFAEALGSAPAELVGRDELDLYHPDSHETLLEGRERCVREGAVRNIDVEMVAPDEKRFVVRYSAGAIYDDGEVVALRTWSRDITDLKEAKEHLRAKTRRLEQSNRELEQFAYLASHDLQEPLRMVASYTELLAKRYEDELDEQAQRYIEYAVEGAERMKALLNDLLEYSRVGRDEAEFERVDLDDVMDSVAANLRMRIAESGAELGRGDLPEVLGSRTQLVQLLQNLVENGLKFNHSESPRVDVRAERDGDRCRISVSDNGIGIDTENADRIFQVFQRLNERDSFEGTGIGLAIADKIVTAHGGDIEIDAESDEGTTFVFDLERA